MPLFKHAALSLAAAAALTTACSSADDRAADNIIYSNDSFTVYTDSVVQDGMTARAISPTEITTTYRSADPSASSPLVRFRFSLNSRDNEMTSGITHAAVIRPGVTDSTVYTFGRVAPFEPVDTTVSDTLPKNVAWHVLLDMRPILRSFDRHGYYVAADADTIFADDFKGVWIAGSVDPLNWDFENLYGKHDRKLRDRGDSIYEVTLTVNPPVASRPDPTGWSIDSVDTRFPLYSSPQTLVDALYNMGISDIVSDIRPDDTFRAGREWDGVWTRDVAYSIYLSLAYLDPERSKNSLRAKVRDGRIVQDTGTGGAWPVSTDRVVWAIAAWEIYTVTGDRQWLSEAFSIIENTLRDDMAVAWDPARSLMHGEQSYLDWREQTYPRWMQPADIFQSMCLGTNVLSARTYELMALMAVELDRDPVPYRSVSARIRRAINDELWIPNLGYYSEYLYCAPYPLQSQATDNLGQSLAVLFDIATPEMAGEVISKTPVGIFGTTSVYPQMADIRPYHNDAVWPFVQAFWNLAAAKTLNYQALSAGLGAIYRAAALFATDKELFVASTGDYRGTAVNSDAQLWSAAGNVAMVFRVLAGMHFAPDGITFHPVVPDAFKGPKTITGFRYRDAVLDITVNGTGDKIASFTIDGKNVPSRVDATLKGHHSVVINLAGNRPPAKSHTVVDPTFMPATPVVTWSGDKARIDNFDPALSYGLYVNGVMTGEIDSPDYRMFDARSFTAVNFVPIHDNRISGFSMRPFFFFPPGSLFTLQAEDFAAPGTSLIADEQKAARFIELSTARNTHVDFTFEAPADGDYFVDLRYANGSGPINTDSKCAIRTLSVNGQRAGAIVMPQRGIGEWLSTGFSNMLPVTLHRGTNTLSVDYITPFNINMNGDVNTALVDYMRIIRK